MDTFTAAVPSSGCPGRHWLLAFDQGRLSARDVEAVAAHVSWCDLCMEALRDIQTELEEDAAAGPVQLRLELSTSPEGPTRAIDAPSARPDAPRRRRVPRPERDTWTGKAVGPYELVRQIGQGGMGVVYLARQPERDRPVALKMVLSGRHAGVRALERFARERRAIGRLDHPNVVRVYDFGEHEGQPYFAMELVESGSLAGRMADGPLEVRTAAELVRTLAEAVHFVHLEGVIHRDLKPSNILLSSDGTPKISDFGLAKFVDVDPAEGPDSEPMLSESDVIMGTPSYMAPEQAEARSSDMGRATDVYALGAILYEALTGRPPFEGQSKPQTLELVRKAQAVPPSRWRPEVPRSLDAICLKCLEKPTWRRYATAQALADDLGGWLRGDHPGNRPRLARWIARDARRHVAALLIGLVAFAGAAATYVSRSVRPAEPPIRREKADEPPRRQERQGGGREGAGERRMEGEQRREGGEHRRG